MKLSILGIICIIQFLVMLYIDLFFIILITKLFKIKDIQILYTITYLENTFFSGFLPIIMYFIYIFLSDVGRGLCAGFFNFDYLEYLIK